jgi:magnesium transporter
MLQTLYYEKGRYEKVTDADLSATEDKRLWIQLIAPTENEVQYIVKKLNVPEDFVRSALDDEERARIDDDEDTGCSLVVFDIPVTESDSAEADAPYTTMPLAVIMKDNTVITVSLNDNPIFHDIQIGKEKKNILLESDKLLYQLLLAFHTQYTKYLRTIDKTSARIESQLSNYTKNYEILKLMKLKNALIYFASSLRQNILVVKQLRSLMKDKEDDIETLENIEVEVEQAFVTCNLQRELMTETMNTYSSIMSNRLADIMRVLTIVTIILAIPTLIAGFWGMNTALPFATQNSFLGFWIIVAITVSACFLAVFLIMPRKQSLHNAPHKKRKKRRRK